MAGVALLGVGAWLLYTNVFGAIPLKTYQGEGYSVLVPRDYEEESTSSAVTFSEPEAERDTKSMVSVSKLDVPSEYRDQYIKMLESSLNEDSLTSTVQSSASTVKDFKSEEITHNGIEGRKLTATAVKDDKRVGDFTMMILYDEDAFYYVIVAAHESDPALARATDKIISSFKTEE